MECALCKIQYVEKAETAFNIRLNNHRKDVNNPKSIPAAFHFRKPGHLFNLHVKFTLIKWLITIHTTDKETLKFWLKCCEDFWIQKLETLTPEELTQELNNVKIPVNCISCSLFSIFDCSLEMKRRITWQRKLDVKFGSFCKLAYIHKIPLKTIERLKLVGKADFLLTFLPALIVQTILCLMGMLGVAIGKLLQSHQKNWERYQPET